MAEEQLYRKSFLFEVVNKNNPSTPIEAFTLTIPPESMEIEEPQRISKTKTFGGTFIDDMGPDIMPIRISGNTGGAKLRETFIPSNTLSGGSPTKEFDGKSAFHTFRSKIMRYKDNKSRKSTYHNYEIYLYDLSTIPQNVALTSNNIEVYSEGYVVVLDSFKLSRNKEKPLFYNYNIELTALRKLGSPSKIFKAPITTQKPFSLLAALRRGLRLIKTYFTDIRNIGDQVDAIINIVGDLDLAMNDFVYQLTDLILYPSDLIKNLIVTTNTLGLSVEDAFEDMVTLIGNDEDEFYDVVMATREMQYMSFSLLAYGKTPHSVGSEVVKLHTEDTITQSSLTRYEDKTVQESEFVVETLNEETGEVELFTIYGYTIVTATGSLTMEKLAFEYFGDASLSYLIAAFNNFTTDDDYDVGDQIRVPVLTRGSAPEDNFIYTFVSRDIYGIDIRIDGNKKLIVSAAGDLATIEGTDNLIQGMNSRLNEKLGARLRLTVYGIIANVGYAMTNSAPLSYMITALKDTLLQDPRIDAINNIKVSGNQSALLLSFNTKTIKLGDVIPYQGKV